jgi:ribosomal 30S subunit maturation factor RimM
MPTPSKWQTGIRIGFQVFEKNGTEEFGAVREICPGGRQELLINVENGGDHCIPMRAILDVHDEKVIVDISRLPAGLKALVKHAHDREVRGL